MSERDQLTFLSHAARQYDKAGQELFELPAWAWIRRRKLLGWRRHYAMRIADEISAQLQQTHENSLVPPDRTPEGGAE